MLCVPVWNQDKISYLSVPLGYRMWKKKESKLELAATMIRKVMPQFQSREHVIIFCAWQEKAPLNQTGSDWMKYIPLFLYSFRWNIETSDYEQKTFWSFCSYMVRSCKGIEMLVNLINISYCAMKLLPYQDKTFSEYRTKSVQEFRFELSQGIRRQIFFATFVKNVETHIKTNAVKKALNRLIHQQVYHL